MNTIEHISETNKIIRIYTDTLKQYEYTNFNIICAQFELWIGILLYMKIVHRKNAIKCMNLYRFFSDATVYEHKKKKTDLTNKYGSLFLNILYFLPLPYGVLSGGLMNLFDKFIFSLTCNKLLLVKPSINIEFRNNFKENLKRENFQLCDYILLHIPDFFFYNQIISKTMPCKIFLSPDNLFKDEFCHISFFSQPLNLIGIQHGGFTNEAKNNLFHEFDLKVTKKMIYWGLGDINIKQNRFQIKKNKSPVFNKVFLVDSLDTNLVLAYFLCDLTNIQMDAISNRIKLLESIKFTILNHPRTKSKSSNDLTFSKLDNNILESSIFILDLPFHTFFYRAVYQDLKFVLYLNPDWKPYYTKHYFDFIEFLKKNDYLYYWGEEDLLKKKINTIMEFKNNINSNQVIREYLTHVCN